MRFADLDEVIELLGGTAPQDDQFQPMGFGNQLGSISGSYANGMYSPPMQQVPTMNPTAQTTQGVALRINDHVAADRRLNAIVVSGTDSDIQSVADLIGAVDVPDSPHASVTFEAKILELTASAAHRVGIDFSNIGSIASPGMEVQSFQEPVFGLHLQAQINAEISKGGGKLLASPRVQTANGTPASIITGDALPIVTTITYPGNPPTVEQQLQYVNVGVHLQIQPHISSNGFITSRIIAEVSNVTAFSEGNIPQISQRIASATARVVDGQPYVIGGLLQDNEIDSVGKIPILGDLPLIGSLFRSRNESHERTDLYIIITPHIVRDGAKAP